MTEVLFFYLYIYYNKLKEVDYMKPYVICHMLMSIDGKVTGSFLNDERSQEAIEYYYEINRNLTKDAIALGKVTMEESFTKGYYPDLSKYDTKILKEDYIEDSNYNRYMIAFDRKGKLGYTSNLIKDEDEGYNNFKIIEVLTKDVSLAYLSYLRNLGISYIFAGENDLDMKLALNKLYRLFSIKRIVLEGGSIINGAFLKDDLVDEISLVVVPLIADHNDKSLFYNSEIKGFKLEKIEKINNFIHVIYRR